MSAMEMAVISLAVWRVTNMVTNEDGPGNIFGIIRKRLVSKKPKPGSLSDLVSCPYCLSVWLSIMVFMAFAIDRDDTLLVATPFAIAGVCSLLQQLTYDRPYQGSQTEIPEPPEPLEG